QRREHALAVVAVQRPGFIADHRDHVVHPQQPLHDEVRQFAALRLGQQPGCAVHDLGVRLALGRLRRRCHGRPEVFKVAVVEFEVERDRHGGRPCAVVVAETTSLANVQRRATTASVSLDTQASRPGSSSMRISQTWVLRPTCSGRAVPVSVPSRTPTRWLALISMPTTPWPSSTHMPPAVLPRVSASSTEAPPCNSPYGWRVRSSTGRVPRTKSSPTSVNTIPSGRIAVPSDRALSCSTVARRRKSDIGTA